MTEEQKRWTIGAYGTEAGGKLIADLEAANTDEERRQAIGRAESADVRIMRLNRPQDRVMTPFPGIYGTK
jgi:hypothetical protein